MATGLQSTGGLLFTSMADRGVHYGFDLKYESGDKTADLDLCIGRPDNKVRISGTTPLSRQAAILAAIDSLELWNQEISLWLVSSKAHQVTAQAGPVMYRTHVKPFVGPLNMRGMATDQPRLTYPGNGHGRVLSKPINGRRYFAYGGRFETDSTLRGFDCTTFPMVLLSVDRLPGKGYGSQLCDALDAEKCGLEQVHRMELEKRFKADSIPEGIYVVFSEGHVMLYNSDINTLYEFNYGGFRATPAPQREMKAMRDLWWLRKLDEDYRPAFVR